MTPAACPECGRCANCSEWLAAEEENCQCGFPADEKLAKWMNKHYGIADEDVEREKAKRERLKKLEPVKRAGRIALLVICILLGLVTAKLVFADSNDFTLVALGPLVACILVLMYWVGLRGVIRIIFWAGNTAARRGR
jgi:hypothetical protein